MKKNPTLVTPHRSGFVAVVGRPNVGKSTLINSLLQQKIAAVSPRPQTTRRRQLGILSTEQAQVILVDTPGIHRPLHKLGEYMIRESVAILNDADCILWLVDASQPPDDEDRLVAARLEVLDTSTPIILVLNKMDLINAEALLRRKDDYSILLPRASTQSICAASGRGQKELIAAVIELLPQGRPFFDSEQVTDLVERDIAADLIRESALKHLHEEVPHSLAVRVDEYSERGDTGAFIHATIFVERESHKGIVIGKGAEMLKNIGSAARKEIEVMSGRKVFLELMVKVNKNWRDNPDALRHFGYFDRE